MGASTPEGGLSRLLRRHIVIALLAVGVHPVAAQVEAEPLLNGRVLVNGTPAAAGPVVLHRVTTETQGEVDSVTTGPDGAFTFRLPAVPDPERGDVYFASLRHHGILYFGGAITLAVQLDSLYEIQAFDTLSVAPEGATFPVQVRNTFLEPSDGGWQVTDLLQIRNDGDHTLVAREGGVVWRYPLAVGSRGHELGQGNAADAVAFEGEDLVVRTPIGPGERLFVVRYLLDDPFIELPMPGTTEVVELLVREPAPPLTTGALTAVESVELEAGSTYRRYTGTDLSETVVRFREGERTGRFPVEWIAVLLALVLAGFGVAAASRAAPVSEPAAEAETQSRHSLVLEIARMDEAYESLSAPSEEERAAYQRRRRDLLRRLKNMG